MFQTCHSKDEFPGPPFSLCKFVSAKGFEPSSMYLSDGAISTSWSLFFRDLRIFAIQRGHRRPRVRFFPVFASDNRLGRRASPLIVHSLSHVRVCVITERCIKQNVADKVGRGRLSVPFFFCTSCCDRKCDVQKLSSTIFDTQGRRCAHGAAFAASAEACPTKPFFEVHSASRVPSRRVVATSAVSSRVSSPESFTL